MKLILEKGFQKNQYLRLQIAKYSNTRHLHNYMTKPVWSIGCLHLEESSYTQLPGAKITNICMQGKFLTNGAFLPKQYLTV